MPHRCWNVYNEFRTARLNVLYYGCLLGRARRLSFWLDFITALSSSAAVAGIWLFQSDLGKVVWKIFGSIAAILSVYRAISKPSEKVRELERRVTGYSTLDFDLENISRKIGEKKDYSLALQKQFEAVLRRKRELVLGYSDSEPNDRLRAKCEKQVMKELPESSFVDLP